MISALYSLYQHEQDIPERNNCRENIITYLKSQQISYKFKSLHQERRLFSTSGPLPRDATAWSVALPNVTGTLRERPVPPSAPSYGQGLVSSKLKDKVFNIEAQEHDQYLSREQRLLVRKGQLQQQQRKRMQWRREREYVKNVIADVPDKIQEEERDYSDDSGDENYLIPETNIDFSQDQDHQYEDNQFAVESHQYGFQKKGSLKKFQKSAIKSSFEKERPKKSQIKKISSKNSLRLDDQGPSVQSAGSGGKKAKHLHSEKRHSHHGKQAHKNRAKAKRQGMFEAADDILNGDEKAILSKQNDAIVSSFDSIVKNEEEVERE